MSVQEAEPIRVSMPTDHDREVYLPMAEKICAAWLSHQMGIKSVDYTLKAYVRVDGPVSDFWIMVARDITNVMTSTPRAT